VRAGTGPEDNLCIYEKVRNRRLAKIRNEKLHNLCYPPRFGRLGRTKRMGVVFIKCRIEGGVTGASEKEEIESTDFTETSALKLRKLSLNF
jgi:hypothetical protein